MIDPALLLIPVLVLPVVLLFRFVGCGFDGVATGVFPPPTVDPLRYAKYLMGDPRDVAIQTHPLVRPNKDNIIGYWRLVDGDGKPAKNEIGSNHGSYKANKGAQIAFLSGQKSLVSSDTTSTCRSFIEGFVVVPYESGRTYTSAFTIEAWIEAQWTPGTKGRHTLFSAGGHFMAELASTKADHGFELFADYVNGEVRWDAVVFGHVGVLFKDPPNKLPIVPRPGPTHVALTVAAPNSSTGDQQVTLFVGGKPTVSASVGIFFSLPNGAPLFIGINPNTPDDADADGTSPILSKVQEVVLHKKALSAEEIENHATFRTQ